MRIGEPVTLLYQKDFTEVYIEELRKRGLNVTSENFAVFDPEATNTENECLDAFVAATQRWFEES